MAWLVENTRDRERLASNNGERCLLHAAARYGQVSLTAPIYLNSATFSVSVNRQLCPKCGQMLQS